MKKKRTKKGDYMFLQEKIFERCHKLRLLPPMKEGGEEVDCIGLLTLIKAANRYDNANHDELKKLALMVRRLYFRQREIEGANAMKIIDEIFAQNPEPMPEWLEEYLKRGGVIKMDEQKIKNLAEVDGVNATAEALDYFYTWYKTDKGTNKKAAAAYLMILGAYYAGVLNDAKFVYETNKRLKGGK